MLCKRCVLPGDAPGLRLNDQGVCNICSAAEGRSSSGKPGEPLESELVALLDRYRGRGMYDCLVMCSGGKDSVMSLYYMKKRYRMTPLAFTFDHGFEPGGALENVKNAVQKLGVDWLYYKTGFMKDVFARVIKSGAKAPICHVCAIWYIKLTYDTAARYGIPLLVGGWTRGQRGEGPSMDAYKAMSGATAEFITRELRKDPRYRDFPRSVKEAAAKGRRRSKGVMISPHWYLPWDPGKAGNILRDELGWKEIPKSYPKGSTNCLMNFVSVYLTMKNYGYTHYHVEMSDLVRKGRMSREEALKLLEIDFGKEELRPILESIGCGTEDLP